MTSSRPEDFAADTLAILLRRGVTFRGLHPASMDIHLDGTLTLWFAGTDTKNGGEVRKKLTMMLDAGVKDAIHTGSPEVIAEVAEHLIDHNSARFF
jgi:hypothetical protein